MKKANRNNDAAVKAFIGTSAEITERLEMLKAYVDDHMEIAPEAVHWGHVGTAQHVLEMLKEITVSLNLEKGEE